MSYDEVCNNQGGLTAMFLYGTLQTGQPMEHMVNQPDLGVSRFIGAAITVDSFPLVIATKYNVPFLLPVKGMGKPVRGELWLMDDAMVACMDEFEHYPHLYDKMQVPVLIPGVKGWRGTPVKASVYCARRYPAGLINRREFYSQYDAHGAHGKSLIIPELGAAALHEERFLDELLHGLEDSEEHHRIRTRSFMWELDNLA